MEDLMQEVRNLKIANVSILVSDMNESGEGEYKILKHIEGMSNKRKLLIVSPDSDMVL